MDTMTDKGKLDTKKAGTYEVKVIAVDKMEIRQRNHLK